MALTVTITADPTTAAKRFVIGDRRCVVGEITFDNSYPTGGEVILPADLGLDFQIDIVLFNGLDKAGSRLVAWDQANKKAKVFTAFSTEAANTSDQSSVVVPFMAIGK